MTLRYISAELRETEAGLFGQLPPLDEEHRVDDQSPLRPIGSRTVYRILAQSEWQRQSDGRSKRYWLVRVLRGRDTQWNFTDAVSQITGRPIRQNAAALETYVQETYDPRSKERKIDYFCVNIERAPRLLELHQKEETNKDAYGDPIKSYPFCSDGYMARLWYIQRETHATAKQRLIKAAAGGRIDDVRRLLEEPNINVNTADRFGATALISAASEGHADVVRLLLEKAPDINMDATDGYGNTALIQAAGDGHTDVVRLLLEKVPDINVNTHALAYYTALTLAAAAGHADIVQQLLEVPGIDINAVNGHQRSALMLAAREGHADIVRLLVEAAPDIDVNRRDEDDTTALRLAAAAGHADVVRQLINVDGIDVNASDWVNRVTALMDAVWKGHVDVVRLLLTVPGIDVNAKEIDGATALTAAQEGGGGRKRYEIVAMLKEKMREQDPQQQSPRRSKRQRVRCKLCGASIQQQSHCGTCGTAK